MKKHFVPYHVFVELEDGLEFCPLSVSIELINKGFSFEKQISKYEDPQKGGFIYIQKEG